MHDIEENYGLGPWDLILLESRVQTRVFYAINRLSYPEFRGSI